MVTPPDAPADAKARERQRQLENLATRSIDEAATAAVEKVAGAAVIASLCAHVGLVAFGAWLMTRGGPLIGTYGSACLLVDMLLYGFVLVPVVRVALERPVVRGVLVATAAVGALVSIATLLACFFGKLGPFQPLSLKGGVLILFMLAFLGFYGAFSAWLAWLLAFNPADTIRKHYLIRESA